MSMASDRDPHRRAFSHSHIDRVGAAIRLVMDSDPLDISDGPTLHDDMDSGKPLSLSSSSSIDDDLQTCHTFSEMPSSQIIASVISDKRSSVDLFLDIFGSDSDSDESDFTEHHFRIGTDRSPQMSFTGKHRLTQRLLSTTSADSTDDDTSISLFNTTSSPSSISNIANPRLRPASASGTQIQNIPSFSFPTHPSSPGSSAKSIPNSPAHSSDIGVAVCSPELSSISSSLHSSSPSPSSASPSSSQTSSANSSPYSTSISKFNNLDPADVSVLVAPAVSSLASDLKPSPETSEFLSRCMSSDPTDSTNSQSDLKASPGTPSAQTVKLNLPTPHNSPQPPQESAATSSMQSSKSTVSSLLLPPSPPLNHVDLIIPAEQSAETSAVSVETSNKSTFASNPEYSASHNREKSNASTLTTSTISSMISTTDTVLGGPLGEIAAAGNMAVPSDSSSAVLLVASPDHPQQGLSLNASSSQTHMRSSIRRKTRNRSRTLSVSSLASLTHASFVEDFGVPGPTDSTSSNGSESDNVSSSSGEYKSAGASFSDLPFLRNSPNISPSHSTSTSLSSHLATASDNTLTVVPRRRRAERYLHNRLSLSGISLSSSSSSNPASPFFSGTPIVDQSLPSAPSIPFDSNNKGKPVSDILNSKRRSSVSLSSEPLNQENPSSFQESDLSPAVASSTSAVRHIKAFSKSFLMKHNSTTGTTRSLEQHSVPYSTIPESSVLPSTVPTAHKNSAPSTLAPDHPLVLAATATARTLGHKSSMPVLMEYGNDGSALSNVTSNPSNYNSFRKRSMPSFTASLRDELMGSTSSAFDSPPKPLQSDTHINSNLDSGTPSSAPDLNASGTHSHVHTGVPQPGPSTFNTIPRSRSGPLSAALGNLHHRASVASFSNLTSMSNFSSLNFPQDALNHASNNTNPSTPNNVSPPAVKPNDSESSNSNKFTIARLFKRRTASATTTADEGSFHSTFSKHKFFHRSSGQRSVSVTDIPEESTSTENVLRKGVSRKPVRKNSLLDIPTIPSIHPGKWEDDPLIEQYFQGDEEKEHTDTENKPLTASTKVSSTATPSVPAKNTSRRLSVEPNSKHYSDIERMIAESNSYDEDINLNEPSDQDRADVLQTKTRFLERKVVSLKNDIDGLRTIIEQERMKEEELERKKKEIDFKNIGSSLSTSHSKEGAGLSSIQRQALENTLTKKMQELDYTQRICHEAGVLLSRAYKKRKNGGGAATEFWVQSISS